jgi:hypothetical protein
MFLERYARRFIHQRGEDAKLSQRVNRLVKIYTTQLVFAHARFGRRTKE